MDDDDVAELLGRAGSHWRSGVPPVGYDGTPTTRRRAGWTWIAAAAAAVAVIVVATTIVVGHRGSTATGPTAPAVPESSSSTAHPSSPTSSSTPSRSTAPATGSVVTQYSGAPTGSFGPSVEYGITPAIGPSSFVVAWDPSGRDVLVITYGSGSCPNPVVGAIETGDQQLEVVTAADVEKEAGSVVMRSCTADLATFTTVLTVPDGIVATKPLEIVMDGYHLVLPALRPAPSSTGTLMVLPTSDWKPGSAAMEALLNGVLVEDQNGCLRVDRTDDYGTTVRVYLVWPRGYSARRTPTGVEVIGADGAVKAAVGEQLSITGGFGEPPAGEPCTGTSPFLANTDDFHFGQPTR